jgi:uncharacterized protein
MSFVVLAFGLVLVVEGLAMALAPSRIEEALAYLVSLSRDRQRAIGLVALAIGVALVWLSGRAG